MKDASLAGDSAMIRRIEAEALPNGCQAGAAKASRWTSETLLTPKQVAERLGVSVDWVQAHATQKRPSIDHVRVGKLIRFTPQQVEDFIREQAVVHKSKWN